MLVLSRKHRESLVIGGSDAIHRLLKVTVLRIQGTTVQLGFEVDPDVPAHRFEARGQVNVTGLAGNSANGLLLPMVRADEYVQPNGDDTAMNVDNMNGTHRRAAQNHN